VGEVGRESGVKLSWNASFKKIVAAVLHVVGVFSVLFVAYQGYEHPGSEVGYMLLYWIGVVLVVVAAVLWPRPEGVRDKVRRAEEGGRGERHDP
jgi:drug/metabolite transporter (DMT)-like permease